MMAFFFVKHLTPRVLSMNTVFEDDGGQAEYVIVLLDGNHR